MLHDPIVGSVVTDGSRFFNDIHSRGQILYGSLTKLPIDVEERSKQSRGAFVIDIAVWRETKYATFCVETALPFSVADRVTSNATIMGKKKSKAEVCVAGSLRKKNSLRDVQGIEGKREIISA